MTVFVSMLEFFRTGAFGPLRVGMDRAEIEAALGPPDDYVILSRRERRRYKQEDHWRHSGVWRYGGVELLFDQQDYLRGVHLDHLDVSLLSGGEKLHIDTWILRPGLALVEAEAALTACHLAYHLRPDPFNKGVVHLALETGPLLYFGVEAEGNTAVPSGLCVIDFPDKLRGA